MLVLNADYLKPTVIFHGKHFENTSKALQKHFRCHDKNIIL